LLKTKCRVNNYNYSICLYHKTLFLLLLRMHFFILIICQLLT